MSDPIAPISATSGIVPDVVNPEIPPASAQTAFEGNDSANQRLVIEAVAPNRFVYKVMDRLTGEVIRQLPREHVEKMITDPSYRDGSLVKTSA